ncbi:MAG: gamma-glutamyltransferase family protein [Anaerolineae bacterium]|nr:gamma-glutamyltransferase family protein [Anaerolineae bacterium]
MSSGMIVAPQPLAVEEGAKVLAAGGNAIDAAVTCAFVQTVVSPQMCGIGGYAVLTMSLAPGQSLPLADRLISLDAPALAGSRVRPDMWQDIALSPNPGGWGYFVEGCVNDQGYQSICTPGTVRALALMLERWGTLSWQEAIAPAQDLAREGFKVDAHLAAGWKAKPAYPEACSLLDRIHANAAARDIYLHEDGASYEAGEILRNPDYAATLGQLAECGADDFYSGALAERMSRGLEKNGSFVTAEDLTTYHLRETEAVVGMYRGYTVYSSPAPHGGPTLVELLNVLEGYDLAAMVHNSPEYIHLLAMAMKAAFADRNPNLGDPEAVDVPLKWMTSKSRAVEWRACMDAGEGIGVSFVPMEAPDTTHLSVVDRDGNCVALTHSLGSSSGVITPGMGFMYNNSMVNFHPWPGHPNSIAPRKSRTTGMSPTIVCRDGKPLLVIGAPGATRIITSIAQVLINGLDFGMSITDAVLAPRIDCQGDVIECQARIPEYVCAEVRKKHPIRRLPQSHGGLALVHAIRINPETGDVSGAADAGSGGMALAV